jgi:hypothetical protein
MSTPVAAFRLRRVPPSAGTAVAVKQWAQKRVAITWALLFMNALTFYPGLSFIHIPSVLGKLITQGCLVVAFCMVLAVNRRRLLRPNVFLCLMSLIAIEALITCLTLQHLGTVYRSLRLTTFIAILWLLTPWWGRRDLLLVRCHLRVLLVLLGSALLGLVVAPGHALAYGRLSGAIWPIPPPEVAHYAAIATGLVVVLWFGGYLRGRVALVAVLIAIPVLVLTHTRTALVAMAAGLLIAGLSLIVAKARVRKLFATAGVLIGIVILTLSSFITTWLARGENSQELTNLTGRTTVWSALLTEPRTMFQVLFGQGLSNKSFNGLSIDSNWLASYNDQGLFGVTICAVILVFLLVKAYLQAQGVNRALALFLVTYVLVASFTEVTFTDVSPYLLDLTVAASLLVPASAHRVPS